MLRLLALLMISLATSVPALAHLDAGDHGSLLAGLTHPPSGADHVLAMITVGIWATLMGGRAVWLVPATFVAAMMAGYVAAINGFALPMVEPGVLASVVVLGLLAALAIDIPIAAGMLVVAIFAVFHGFAHGAEVGSAGVWTFATGFALSTAVLHAVGVGASIAITRMFGAETGRTATRTVGAAAAVGGLLMAFT